jgi:hypothetical protein
MWLHQQPSASDNTESEQMQKLPLPTPPSSTPSLNAEFQKMKEPLTYSELLKLMGFTIKEQDGKKLLTEVGSLRKEIEKLKHYAAN